MESGKMGIIDLDGSEEGEMSPLSSSLDQSQSQGQSQSQTEAGVETESEGQGSNVEEASVNDLPPEMWMEILKCVDTRSLLNCRFVSRFWSEISTGILHQRSDAKITFKLAFGQFYQQRTERGQKEKSLNNFLMCMNESENCPFARFAFDCQDENSSSVYSDFFGHEDWKAFLSAVDESNKNENQNENENPRIKIKSLEFQFKNSKESFEVLIENLRELLLNKITDLEEFGLNLSQMWFKEHAERRLFPETDENPKTAVQLPHLKVIHFNETMIEEIPGVVKDLLNAAINLKKIYLYQSSQSFFTEIYDFLHPIGKFHLLKNFAFNLNAISLSEFKQRPDFTDALFKLEMEELRIDRNQALDDDEVASATNFLSTLFESRKNSLRKLTPGPLGCLHRLQFPTFKNLTHLKLQYNFDSRDTFFFPGVRSLDIFPAVRHLDFSEWVVLASAGFPHLDSIPVLPRVHNLHLIGVESTKDTIPVLPLLCPNLKQLTVQGGEWNFSHFNPEWKCLDVGRSIWTHMTQLESLEIDMDLGFPENNSSALDSWFTGISLENCKRLHDIMEGKKTLENGGSQAKVLESGLTAEREHPSVLDMTNLKTLKINAYSRGKLLKGKDFFSEKLTWISEEFAFKFLPHLKPNPNPKA